MIAENLGTEGNLTSEPNPRWRCPRIGWISRKGPLIPKRKRDRRRRDCTKRRIEIASATPPGQTWIRIWSPTQEIGYRNQPCGSLHPLLRIGCPETDLLLPKFWRTPNKKIGRARSYTRSFASLDAGFQKSCECGRRASATEGERRSV